MTEHFINFILFHVFQVQFSCSCINLELYACGFHFLEHPHTYTVCSMPCASL